MAPVIRRLYDQMLEPKWAISMGACCSSMGVFNNYALVPVGQVHADRRARARLPAAARGARARDPAAARQDPRQPARRAGASATARSAPRSCSPRQRDRRCDERRRSTSSSPGTPPVPDATGLELTAQELREIDSESILDTEFHREPRDADRRADSDPDGPRAPPAKGYTFLASLHGVDYYPHEPRLGVLYELLDMHGRRPDHRQGPRPHRGAAHRRR